MSWPLIPSGWDPPGRVVYSVFHHDAWCQTLHSDKPCNCNPDITRHLQPQDFDQGDRAALGLRENPPTN